MNGFDLAGQLLRVGRAIIPRGISLPFELANSRGLTSSGANQVSASAVALAAASISAKVMSMSAEELNAINNVDGGSLSASGFSGSVIPVPNLPPPGVFIPTAIGDNLSFDHDQSQDNTAPVWDEDVEAVIPVVNDETVDQLPITDESHEEFVVPTVPNDDEPAINMSRVLLLENMVGVDEVDDYLRKEVTEECGNYGQVLHVLIHILPNEDVRIFIQFDSSDDAVIACNALNQRYFAGRVVHAKIYDEELFQLHQLEA